MVGEMASRMATTTTPAFPPPLRPIPFLRCSSPVPLRFSRAGTGIRCSASDRQQLFSRIAPVYDNLNDVLSLGLHRTWKRMCVSWSRAKRGDRVLDLCCGSGDLAFVLSQKVGFDGEVKAVDFSSVQLKAAASKQEMYWKSCYDNITAISVNMTSFSIIPTDVKHIGSWPLNKWIEGDALNLPFENCYFDAITVGYGLRNVTDKPRALKEIYRVLKPGSRGSILDFNKSKSPLVTSIQDWSIDNIVVPLASTYGLSEEYKYLKSSIAEFLTGDELDNLAKEVGFSSAKHYEINCGLMGNLVITR